MQNFLDILKAHPYPGRGIMLGKTADGAKSVVVYFIVFLKLLMTESAPRLSTKAK